MAYTKSQWERWKREHPDEWQKRAEKIAHSHKGKQLSAKHRAAIAKAMRGRRLSVQQRKKIAQSVKKARSTSQPSRLHHAVKKISFGRIRFERKHALYAAGFLAIVLIITFGLTNLGLFAQADWTKSWENRKELTVDNNIEYVTTHVNFGLYRPEKCEDGILVATGEQNVSFNVLKPVTDENGRCSEADVQFRNVIYAPAAVEINFVDPTPADGATLNENFFTVKVFATEGMNFTLIEWGNGTDKSTDVMSGSGTEWSYDLNNLTDGAYRYRVLATNITDDTITTDYRLVKIATVTGPTGNVTAPVENITALPENMTANSTVPDKKIKKNNTAHIENETPSVSPQENTTASAENTTQNESSPTGSALEPPRATYYIYYGKKPPLKLSEVIFEPPTPPNGLCLAQDWMFINASTDAEAAVSVLEWTYANGTSMTLPMGGVGTSWFYNVTNLATGNYTFRVFATDAEGNTVVSETRRLMIDMNASVKLVQTFRWLPPTPADGKTVQSNSITFNLKLTLPAKDVAMDWNGTAIPMTGSATSWQLNLNNLTVGGYNYRATADNVASQPREVTVKSTVKFKGQTFNATERAGYQWAAEEWRNKVYFEDLLGTGDGVSYQTGDSWANWQLIGIAKGQPSIEQSANETVAGEPSGGPTGLVLANSGAPQGEAEASKARRGDAGIVAAIKPAEAAVEEANIAYNQALPGVDLQYIYSSDLLKETITIADRSVLASGDNEFRWSLSYSPDVEPEIGGATLAGEATGDMVFFKSGGAPVFYFTQPFVIDAAGSRLDLTYRVWQADNRTWIAIGLPGKWLDNAEYPVVLDPTMSSVLWNVSDVFALGGGRSEASSSVTNATFVVGEAVIGQSSSLTGNFIGTACLGFFCTAFDITAPVVGVPYFNVSNPSIYNTNIQVNATYSDDTGVASCVVTLSGANTGSYSMTLVNSTYPANVQGTATVTIAGPLNGGTTSYTVKCTDNNGNVGQNSASLQIDATPPTIGNVVVDDSLSSPADQIDLLGGGARVVTGTATVNDPDGQADFNGTLPTSRFRYKPTATNTCSADNNNCYVNSSCVWGSMPNTTAQQLDCTFVIWFNAQNSTGLNWEFNVTVKDTLNRFVSNTDTTDVNALLAVGTQSTIAFGSMGVGDTSASDVNASIQNYGNVQIDLALNGSALTCGTGSIAATYLRYNCTDYGQTYGTNMAYLPSTLSSANCTGFDLAKNSTATTQIPVAPNKNLPWKIKVPSGVLGNCQGTIWFAAVAG